MTKRATIVLAVLVLSVPVAEAQDARKILGASGIQGGLVVVVGCDNPALLAGLRASESFLVHGLDRDPAGVAVARAYLRETSLYGRITVSRWEGPELPYVDSLVNMVVLTAGANVDREELQRVLAPRGVVVDAANSRLKIFRKPWAAELDSWSHALHDASNNAVSTDLLVAPPKGLRWTCGPKYARSHEHFASMSAMVTSGGRIFTIIDEGPISSVYLPPKWSLVARDAFSGVLLWKRPIKDWESHLRSFRSGPPEIGRRLVATNDRLYVALDYGSPVKVLDAATGEELLTVAETDGARELLVSDGTLYVLADDMTTAQHNQRRDSINREFLATSPTLSIWQRFTRKPYPTYGTQRLVAARAESGELVWKRGLEEYDTVLPTTMAVGDGRVCYQSLSHIVCLDSALGNEVWRAPRPAVRSRLAWSTPTLVIHDGVVLSLDRTAGGNKGKSSPDQDAEWIISGGGFEDRQSAELIAHSLDNGKELWRAPYSENYNTPGDVFVINAVVWVGDLRAGRDPGFTQGRDLRTGKIVATLPPQKVGGHHRCYRNKATTNWLMVGRGGVQFIDLKSGAVHGNSWVRGACQYGLMPANGLLYAPQHSCACQPEEMLIGLNALSPQSSAGEGPPPLEKGPAYHERLTADLGSEYDWPTYRGDAQRSGHQELAAPSKLEVAWETQLSSPITAPVAAGGLVFVAETELHVVYALSAESGQPVWTFTADGRIDSPPTICSGRCLFGTRSGFVYCLRASDGELIWRFRAAPRDRRLFAYEQLESVWPVHGAVLVDDKLTRVPTVYFAAGRSSRLDGGIRLYALDAKTGPMLHKADVKQSVLPDILSLQHDTVWMRGLGVDKNLAPVRDEPHLFAPRGFLDDTWWHRTYWMYGTAIGGSYSHWPDVGNVVPAGRLLVFDGGESIYGYGRLRYRMGDGHVGPQAAKDYSLFAEVLPSQPRREGHGDAGGSSQHRQFQWTTQLPFIARAIVLTSDALLVAGGPSLPDTDDQDTSGRLWIVSRGEGAKRFECRIPGTPVLDGMAFANSGIFISAVKGTVTCLRTD